MIEAVILSLACLLFLLACYPILRIIQSTTPRWPWAILAAACVLLGGVCILLIYSFTIAPVFQSTIVAVAILVASILVLCSVFFTYKPYITNSQAKFTAQATARRYLQVFDKDPNLIALKDSQSAFLAANPAYLHFLGKNFEELLEKSDFDVLPRPQAMTSRREEVRVVETGMPSSSLEELDGSDGAHWFKFTRIPLQEESQGVNGVLVYGQEMSGEKQVEKVLTAYQSGLAALTEAELDLAGLYELDRLEESLLEWASRLSGAAHACLCRLDSGTPPIEIQLGIGKLERCTGARLRPGEDLGGKVLQTGQPLVENEYASWPERSAQFKEAGFTAGIGLPLRSNSQVAGALCLYDDRPGLAFPAELVDLLRLYAQIVSARLQCGVKLADSQAESQERLLANTRLQYRLRLEHILAAVATHFIGLAPEKIDESLRRALQSIGKLAEVDRCYIVLFSRDGTQVGENLFAWLERGVEAGRNLLDDLNSEEFQWYLGKLNQLELVHVPRQGDLPPELEEGGAFLKAHLLQSFTVVPMVAHRQLIGYLGFEACRLEMEWPAEVLTLFKICAEMFVNALERKVVAQSMKEAQENAIRLITHLEQSNREGALITEMGDLLQACRTADEAYPIVARYVQRVIQIGSGALYMIRDAQDPAERVAAWGAAPPGPTERELVLNECWALRRGRIYSVKDSQVEPLCGHLKEPFPSSYLCAPLVAQGQAVGILHLRIDPGGPPFSESQQAMAMKIAEYIALALTNLHLRDDLRSQAIRDPLTGLFNRRYMEETLDREIRRASRHGTSVGVIMFDIDRLKPINDTYGHDAGDVLLRSIGGELLRCFRGEDVACRYGGDEFTIVLPEASLADVWRRAEQLRDLIKKLDVQYEGKRLGSCTLSIGVAAYPDHGLTAERLLLASDAASYAAKSEGGDRIMVGRDVEG